MKRQHLSLHHSQVRAECAKPPIRAGPNHSQIIGNRDWSGTSSFQEALKLSINGDFALAAKVDARARELKLDSNNENDTLKIVSSNSGGAVDIEAYLLGLPDCMYDFELRVDKSRVLNIIASSGALANTSTDSMLKYAVSVFAAIRALELKGYSIGLKLHFGNETDGIRHDLFITLKEPGQQLEHAISSFWMSHPASFRRIVFKIWEANFPAIAASYNYGSSGLSLPQEEIPENCLYFESVQAAVYSDLAPWDFIKKRCLANGLSLS